MVNRAAERWLPVLGHEGRYEVSDQGRVRALFKARGFRPGRIMKPVRNTSGYCQVYLHAGANKREVVVIHRLVMQAFAGPCPAGHEINHKDGDKSNNCLDNLEYVTRSENIKHAFATGLMRPVGRQGEETSQAKLTDEQIVEIVRVYAETDLSLKQVGKQYGLTDEPIRRIIRRRSWTHIEIDAGLLQRAQQKLERMKKG